MPRYVLRVNGTSHQVDGAADDSLLSILRYEFGLTGSKFGCGEGACGACTVLVDGQTTRSCVARIGQMAGKEIRTIESLADGDKLHPVQEAFLETEAFQCGYCTTGMIMAVVGLLKTQPNPTDADIVRALDRNVCRCCTYPRLIAAVKLAAQNVQKKKAAAAR